MTFEVNTKWMLTCFYGHHVLDLRVLGYNVLIALKDLHSGLRLCIGDFNELLYSHDKCGGVKRPQNHMQLFHQAL